MYQDLLDMDALVVLEQLRVALRAYEGSLRYLICCLPGASARRSIIEMKLAFITFL